MTKQSNRTRIRHLCLGTFLLITALTLALFVHARHRGEESSSTLSSPSRSIPDVAVAPTNNPARIHTRRKIGISEATSMPPDQWKIAFRKQLKFVPEPTRIEILMLSEELHQAFDRGLPRSDEQAEIYGETMLILLNESTSIPSE